MRTGAFVLFASSITLLFAANPILGTEVVDVPKVPHIYQEYTENPLLRRGSSPILGQR